MQTPFVVPPLGGIAPVNFRLKPVLQTALKPVKTRAKRPLRRGFGLLGFGLLG